jgi:ankyrin repeat protein
LHLGLLNLDFSQFIHENNFSHTPGIARNMIRLLIIVFFFSVIHSNIFSAIQNGDLAKFKKLWSGQNETNPIVYKSSSRTIYTALHQAAYWGKVRIIDFLANKLDNILPYASNGWTPMHYGAFINQPKVIEYYLSSNKTTEKNPGVNSSALNQGRTPLHYACQEGHLNIVKLLVPHLEVKNPGDAYNYTALHVASKNGHLDIIKYLSDVIKVTNPHTSYYWRYTTPLYMAAKNGHLKVVKFLVNNSAAIANEKTLPGFYGKTAYEGAVKAGQTKVSQYLEQFRQKKVSNTCVAPKFAKCPDSNECYMHDLKEGKKIEMLYITLMFFLN